MSQDSQQPIRRILGRVKRDEFVGRSAELDRLVSHAGSSDQGEARGLLILLAPLAGVSELLRQTFDTLFSRREEVVPIYFALPQTETTAVSAAIEFLNTFLRQYVAFRREEPSLCQASLTLDDILQLAPAADNDWIQDLIEAYNRQRFGEDDRELVRLCLSAPRRVPANIGARPFVMFDAVQLANYDAAPFSFAVEIVRTLRSSDSPFVLAGLRREMLDAVERAGGNSDSLAALRLESFGDEDARSLVTSAAHRQAVALNDETRDLLVQQLEGSPFFITSLLQAARENQLPLTSYLACERLYVDELMGGRLGRFFASVLENVAPEAETRSAVVRLLCEAPHGNRKASFESWRKRLKLDSNQLEQLLRRLHVQELINWDGETIDAEVSSSVWRDYLRSRFRLDALREPRALVVADVIAEALKRAPQTIAKHYRRAASLKLRELAGRFDAQMVPAILFNYAEFAAAYKGAPAEDIATGLNADTRLLRLPQVFHTASGASFSRALSEFGEESSVVAHAFESGSYTDANEIVWLVAKLESKLEASRALVEKWLGLLASVARQSGFVRTQVWLVANEGFSEEAAALLREHNAFGSSQQQFELLTARLTDGLSASSQPSQENEFVLVLPMGADNELLAATTVEQVARRLHFSPEAINQIKTAVIEACINAAEHSLSPERKIYQRFRVENDKLVITISSRGILPPNIASQIAANVEAGSEESAAQGDTKALDNRRGWGLKLIRTLMDEVEFERVDEGTSLRMTKYLRS